MADIVAASPPQGGASSTVRLEETELEASPHAVKSSRFLFLFTLQPGVTSLNFAIYLVAAALGICFFVFLNSSQAFVLGQIVQVPSSTLGNASGSLTFYDELVSIFAVWIWGLLSDRVGRRIVYGAGFLIMAAGLAAFSFPSKLYPDLLLCRLLFAVGGAASSSMMTAVIADYAAEESRGRLSGMVGLVSGCGALIALFVLLRLPAHFGDGVHGLRVTFLIAAGLSALAAVLMWTLLQSHGSMKRNAVLSSPPVSAESRASSYGSIASETNETQVFVPVATGGYVADVKPFTRIAKEGILAGKDPRVFLGYAGSFLARGDTIILTLFLPLWVYKHYIDDGQCTAPGGPEDPNNKTNCHDAYIRASILSGVAQTFALVGAPIFGWLTDRLYRPLPILLSCLMGIAGYLTLHLHATPSSSILFLPMALIGLSEIGTVVGSLALVTATYVPTDVRGSVAGVSSLCGAAGILLTTKLGGVLFDSWTETAPFFIMAVLHLAFLVVIASVMAGDWVRERAIRAQRATGEMEAWLPGMKRRFQERPMMI
ncbi:hypothetical protein HKX48_008357 [Thoreauomyces humboldtii]|nr:hypothetical protein HKX48_008357 [Thoreauomyces humboldtii]